MEIASDCADTIKFNQRRQDNQYNQRSINNQKYHQTNSS